MNSKRIKFALFICVFALCGCASTASVMQRLRSHVSNNYAAASNTIHTESLIQARDSGKELASFHSYGSISESTGIFQSMGDKPNTLLLKAEEQSLEKKMREGLEQEKKRRKAIEKKQKEQELKKKAEKESVQTFSPKITTYGVDCYGCGGESGRGGTALGVALDLNLGVQMPDGAWQPGIKYGDYYIVAADPGIPLCSILKISNHGLSGSGISPDQPYYAIVLDRGGAIQGNHIDLYIGSENSKAIVPVRNTQAKAEVIREGGRSGSNSCALQ